MRVLLTNWALRDPTGSELYIFELASYLKSQEHQVVCFSPILGRLAGELIESGVVVVDDLAHLPEEFDVIHAHHNLPAAMAAARFPFTPMLYCVHGRRPWEEQPLIQPPNLQLFVATCENMADYLCYRHGIGRERIRVVPNFVDTRRFTCRTPINPKPRRVLVLSNHYHATTTQPIVEEACRLAGLELEAIGATTKPVRNVEDYINAADIVITLGRGTLEAMACGRNVVLFDYRGGDGLVTPGNFRKLQKRNFSGSLNARFFTPRELVGELLKATPEIAAANQTIVLQEHTLELAAERLLQIYRECIECFRETLLKGDRQQLLCQNLQSMYHYLGSLRDELTRNLELFPIAAHERGSPAYVEFLEKQVAAQAELLDRIAKGKVMRLLNFLSRLWRG